MSSVYDTVVSALRKIGILDPSEAPEAQQMNDAIGQLNRMCTRWEADGLAIGWVNVANPTDTLPCPIENEDAVIYNLATHMASDYGIVPPPDVVAYAIGSLDSLARDRMVEMPLELNSKLPYGSGRGRSSVEDTYSGRF